MRKSRWLAVVMIIVAACSPANSASEEWSTDFEAARKAAAERNLPILANFAGSDWCGWCIKLQKEVFSKKEFGEYANDNVVLFLADFPSRKKQSAKTKSQNKGLAEKYQVKGFPTVLLLNAKGDVLARTGYRKGGPQKYVGHISKLIAEAKKNETK
jgi:protein disulfide-isomerase